MKRLATPLLCLAIFLLNVWLNAPLFQAGEMPFRGSIEDGYVAMARFISQHPNPWGWNPLPYGGLPVQFMYVPALPYLAGLWMRLLPHVAPGTVYRVIVSLFACLGPVTLFLFALRFTGSRRWSFAAALVYSIFSPSYGLFPAIEKDRGIVQLPWRIQVLAKYGEGPHVTGLALLPLALLGLWRAVMKGTYRSILGAAILLAAIPLTNWLAAFSLAICCTLLLLAASGEPGFRILRAIAAGALAYLLSSFWLTPSFVSTIRVNWPVDSFAYQLGRQQAGLLMSAAAGAILIWLVLRRLGASAYLCFAVMGTFVFGLIATAYYVYGVDTIPESRRYAVEFEWFLILAVVELVRSGMANTNGTLRLCAAGSAGVMLLVGVPQLWGYLIESRGKWQPSPPDSTVEYRLGSWLSAQQPTGRVFATGGMRFRLNSWFDLPQVGGGFETGLQNRVPVLLAYHARVGDTLRHGHEAEDTLLQLKALGAQYVVIHGQKSREYYHDFARPERVTGSLPEVYRTEDDRIFALPARPLAGLATAAELFDGDIRQPQALARYVSAMEDPARPRLQVRWPSAAAVLIEGAIPADKLISLQVNADAGWRATQDGGAIGLSKDALGFLVLHPSPSAATQILLEYRGTVEQRVMAAICALTWLAALFAFGRVIFVG